jgi:hypothetical protein
VLLISHGPGNDPHKPARGRILSEQDIKVARIADSRIAEAFDRLDKGIRAVHAKTYGFMGMKNQ